MDKIERDLGAVDNSINDLNKKRDTKKSLLDDIKENADTVAP